MVMSSDMNHCIRSHGCVLAFLLAIQSLLQCSVEAIPHGDFRYQKAGTEITITAYAGTDDEVLIPEVIENLPVTRIGDNSFTGKRFQRVVLPGTIHTIGVNAFANCSRLAEINLPNSLRTINSSAFLRCTALKALVLPEGVITLGQNAFGSCTGLTEVSLPASLTSLGGGAFARTTSLLEFKVAGANPNFSAVNGVLCSRDGTRIIQFPPGRSGIYEMPDIVTALATGAFAGVKGPLSVVASARLVNFGSSFNGATGVVRIVLPPTLPRIPSSAFLGCTGLTNIVIPNTVTNIGEKAFSSCVSLAEVTLPGSLVSIDSEAFANCEGLKRIAFPGSLREVGAFAFNRCFGLTDLAIPEGVTTFGLGAFVECTNLVQVRLPASLMSQTDSFSRCYGLERVEVAEGSLAFKSQDGVLFNDTGISLVLFPKARRERYQIPETVTSIAFGAFTAARLEQLSIPAGVANIFAGSLRGCPNLRSIVVHPQNPNFKDLDGALCNKEGNRLIQYPSGRPGSYVLPGSITIIEDGAFEGAFGLTSIELHNDLLSIGSGAFSECINLQEISLPASLNFIGAGAFANCPRLSRVEVSGNRDNRFGFQYFDGSSGVIVYYPIGSSGWQGEWSGRPSALQRTPPNYSEWVTTTELPSRYPQASAGTDDPDEDGATNEQEMRAQTNPVDPNSRLMIEPGPRSTALPVDERGSVPPGYVGIYVQTRSGKSYAVQHGPSVDGPWAVNSVFTATTSQRRVLFIRPSGNVFYRVILAE